MIEPFKPWKSFTEQVDLLEERGMVFRDKHKAEEALKRIGYYRLSGYWYPFRQFLPLPQPKTQTSKRSDYFVIGTQFDDVVALYQFDNQIKLLALEAIQHIEIAMRVQISHVLGEVSPIAHLEQGYFAPDFELENWWVKYYGLFNRHLSSDKKANNETHGQAVGFVLHNKQKYGSLPIWVACELWDFGALSQLFSGLLPSYQTSIATQFGLSAKQLASHLRTFNFVRNVAAHHDRLWNKHIINRPKLDFQGNQWQILSDNEVFAVFCLMQRMLQRIDLHHDWSQRFKAALTLFPTQNTVMNDVSLAKFGIRQGIDLNRWNLWR